MLAKEADHPFDNEDWFFEIKWDGYRAIAETGKDLKLYSRNGISFLDQYPEIAEALQKIKPALILDGEIVAMDSVRPRNGATVSTPLQWKEVKRRLHPSQFDIITVPKRLKKLGVFLKQFWEKELIWKNL
ncbi:MAG: hypothetical protein ABIO46_07710 [Chitinophagales bacterium]